MKNNRQPRKNKNVILSIAEFLYDRMKAAVKQTTLFSKFKHSGDVIRYSQDQGFYWDKVKYEYNRDGITRYYLDQGIEKITSCTQFSQRLFEDREKVVEFGATRVVLETLTLAENAYGYYSVSINHAFNDESITVEGQIRNLEAALYKKDRFDDFVVSVEEAQLKEGRRLRKSEIMSMFYQYRRKAFMVATALQFKSALVALVFVLAKIFGAPVLLAVSMTIGASLMIALYSLLGAIMLDYRFKDAKQFVEDKTAEGINAMVEAYDIIIRLKNNRAVASNGPLCRYYRNVFKKEQREGSFELGDLVKAYQDDPSPENFNQLKVRFIQDQGEVFLRTLEASIRMKRRTLWFSSEAQKTMKKSEKQLRQLRQLCQWKKVLAGGQKIDGFVYSFRKQYGYPEQSDRILPVIKAYLDKPTDENRAVIENIDMTKLLMGTMDHMQSKYKTTSLIIQEVRSLCKELINTLLIPEVTSVVVFSGLTLLVPGMVYAAVWLTLALLILKPFMIDPIEKAVENTVYSQVYYALKYKALIPIAQFILGDDVIHQYDCEHKKATSFEKGCLSLMSLSNTDDIFKPEGSDFRENLTQGTRFQC